MERSPAFFTLHEALSRFISTEQWRRAADTYKEMYQLPIGQGDRLHFYLFSGYTSVLRDNNVTNENDIAFLLTILKTKTIPAEHRAQAGFILGLIYYTLFREEDSKKAFRRVLELTMTATDRARVIFSGVHELTTAGAIFDETVELARGNLHDTTNIPTPYTGLHRRPGTVDDRPPVTRVRGIATASISSRTTADIYMEASKKVRGEACDYCHVKRDTLHTETGETVELKKCSGCGFKWYCSTQCQRNDWSSGHRASCRPIHAPFQPGDIVKIQGIVAQPELNGKLMVVKELPTPDRASYLVAPIGSEHDPTTAATAPSPSQTQSVYGMKVEKLMLVVPVQERIDGQGSGGSDMHKYGS